MTSHGHWVIFGVRRVSGEAVEVLGVRLEPHQVDGVRHGHLQLRRVLAQQLHCRQRPELGTASQHVMTTSGNDLWSFEPRDQTPSPRAEWSSASSAASQSCWGCRVALPPCLPDPGRLAVPTRPVVVRAAPTLPCVSRIRLPSASSDRCDGPKEGSFHPLTVKKRLVGGARPVSSRRRWPPSPPSRRQRHSAMLPADRDRWPWWQMTASSPRWTGQVVSPGSRPPRCRDARPGRQPVRIFVSLLHLQYGLEAAG
jgi:hypothetical protein